MAKMAKMQHGVKPDIFKYAQYWTMLIYSLSLSELTMFRNSIRDGTKFYMSKISSDDVLESLYNLRNVRLCNSEPYWNCTTWRFIRRYRCHNINSCKAW